MHLQTIRFDRVFDAVPQRGDFSFTSAGRTTYGAILPSRAIPAEGNTYVMVFAKPGDWSTLLGYRDMRTGTIWMKHRAAWLALIQLELLYLVAGLAFAVGMTLAGAAVATLMAGAAAALVIGHHLRDNWKVRRLLRSHG